jgi:hypothetical protein
MIEKSKEAHSLDQFTTTLAFPLTKERGDSLSRLGISNELLAQYKIDPEKDGFTIGPLVKSTESGVPERKVGGVEIRLISEEEDLEPIPNLPHGGIVKEETLDGDHFVRFGDGTVRVDWGSGGGMSMNKDGKVIARWYVNPDADQTTVSAPTPEQEAAFLRLRGAVILTVENWSAPDLSGVEPRDSRAPLVLLDPEYAFNTAIVFDAPNVTDAQPEARPDLPNPGTAANPDDFKDKCFVGCP